MPLQPKSAKPTAHPSQDSVPDAALRAWRSRTGEPDGDRVKAPIPKRQRCAIYTRKSTEHNLDLAFNSLDHYFRRSAWIGRTGTSLYGNGEGARAGVRHAGR